MSTRTYKRKAHHAGSWYSESSGDVDRDLAGFLSAAADDSDAVAVTPTDDAPLRAMICPHAGYSYSGPTAAYAYQTLISELKRRKSRLEEKGTNENKLTLLVLHPSHHVYLDGCAVSGAAAIETPVGDIAVDSDLREEILRMSGSVQFSVMEKMVDEREHSGEMQYPFIAKCLSDAGVHSSNSSGDVEDVATINVQILPIMCGSLSTSQERAFGEALASIIARPDIICVLSSDFCHWGSRFSFQPTTDDKAIYEHITALDREGMTHIEMQEPGAFATYLKRTRNTICGRHPIAVWLQAVRYNREQKTETYTIQFVKYAQSSQAQSMRDSSVSYASAVATKQT